MNARVIADLGGALDVLAQNSTPLDTESKARFAEQLGKLFGVKPDEVGILMLVDKGRLLKFVVPEKLQAVGTIPLTSNSALAARTARDKRPDVNNTFTAARHATVFEGVPLSRRRDELIHKIMSAPILAESKVVGVVQISRKGHTPADAGPDFSQQDLRELVGLSDVLARFLTLCQEPSP